MPGYNVRPNEIYASVGISQLKKLDQFIKIRRKIFFYIKTFLKIIKFLKYKLRMEKLAFSLIFIFRKKYLHLKNKIYADLRKNNIQFRLITGGCFLKHTAKNFSITQFIIILIMLTTFMKMVFFR